MARGWKTFGVNLAVALVGVAIGALRDAPIDAAWVGTAIGVLGALNVGLRAITSTPIFNDGSGQTSGS